MKDIMLLKITKHFLENPYEEIYLRELAKKLKISVFAAKSYNDLLVKERIISDRKVANLRYFKLNSSNVFVRHLKLTLNLKKIDDAGLVKHLIEKVPALSSVVLFGSVARGEDDKKSDIDILIIGRTDMFHLNLRDFESKIGKTINEHIFSWTNWKKQAKENKAFYIDIIAHGISLYGEMPII